MCDYLEKLSTLFTPVPVYDAKEEEGNNDDIPLNNIITILNKRHILDDFFILDGAYSDFINSYAFQAKN